jgi:hypothetical protein
MPRRVADPREVAAKANDLKIRSGEKTNSCQLNDPRGDLIRANAKVPGYISVYDIKGARNTALPDTPFTPRVVEAEGQPAREFILQVTKDEQAAIGDRLYATRDNQISAREKQRAMYLTPRRRIELPTVVKIPNHKDSGTCTYTDWNRDAGTQKGASLATAAIFSLLAG